MANEHAKLPFLATRVINTPLMIEPGKLQIILNAIGNRIGLITDSNMAASEITLKAREETTVSETIAVIPVYDTLVYRSGGINAMSGLTSYEEIRASFINALEDRHVEGILFDIDSPGGEVTGVFDLVDTIYHARGTKPIYAMVNEIAFSAAYAIASAADKIYLPRTGGIGSIGVIAIHTDQSNYDEKVGVKYTAIYAGTHKNDFSPHEELSKEAMTSLQEKINEIYDLFIQTVARNRGIMEAVVRNTEAALYQGMHAVDQGLADAVLTWEETVNKLTLEGGTKKMQHLTKPILKAENSELYELILAEGKALVTLEDFKEQTDALVQQAINTERARIMDIFTKAYGADMSAKFAKVVEPGADFTALMEFAKDQAKAEILAKIQKDSPESLGQEIIDTDTEKETETKSFEALVDAYMEEHSCTKGKAIKAIAHQYPEKHAEYVEGLKK